VTGRIQAGEAAALLGVSRRMVLKLIAQRILLGTEALIRDLVLDALRGDGEQSPGASATPAVSRALEFIAAHYAEALTVDDVARAAGVNRRALQSAFQAAGAGTVRDALARARMEVARAALLTAGSDSTVAAIATAAGISQLGRFAIRYRERFGESPSATLARSLAR
jgi:transcriptional regulator GlxA family with amidase domain